MSWLVGSLRVKWDETQQEVSLLMLEAIDEPATTKTKRRQVSKASARSISMFVKLNGLPVLPWFVACRRVARTTANCLWSGLQHAPLGPFAATGFREVPMQLVQWLWLIFVADDASGNNRMIAHAEHTALSTRPKTLVARQPCLIHALHRSVVPILQLHNLSGALYRLALVLHMSSFWVVLTQSVHNVIDSALIVLHNSPIDAMHLRVSRQLLLLTLGGVFRKSTCPTRPKRRSTIG